MVQVLKEEEEEEDQSGPEKRFWIDYIPPWADNAGGVVCFAFVM